MLNFHCQTTSDISLHYQIMWAQLYQKHVTRFDNASLSSITIFSYYFIFFLFQKPKKTKNLTHGYRTICIESLHNLPFWASVVPYNLPNIPHLNVASEHRCWVMGVSYTLKTQAAFVRLYHIRIGYVWTS